MNKRFYKQDSRNSNNRNQINKTHRDLLKWQLSCRSVFLQAWGSEFESPAPVLKASSVVYLTSQHPGSRDRRMSRAMLPTWSCEFRETPPQTINWGWGDGSVSKTLVNRHGNLGSRLPRTHIRLGVMSTFVCVCMPTARWVDTRELPMHTSQLACHSQQWTRES